MLTPTDDQRVTSTTAPLSFTGFTTEPSAPVQVRAWNFATNAMTSVGTAVRATTAATNVGGTPLYSWSASRTLSSSFWRSGPAGGQCAVVGATTTVGGRTENVMTVEADWGECYDDNPTATGFYNNCGSSNNPVAKIYTTTWGSVPVPASQLALAGLVASSQVRLVLDNYTPTAYQFCRSGNPAGCPPGLSSDPETYKYYRPNGSSLTANGDTQTFSITPSRSDPMTIYLDDMSSRSLDFAVVGGRFLLGITFESAGPEIRMNCIRNVACAFVDGRTIDFTAPRAVLSFALSVEDGRVTYTDVTTTFTTGLSGGDATSAANAIASAITEKLMDDDDIRSSVSAALDAVVRGAAALGPFPVEAVNLSGSTLSVQPGCPMD